MIRPSRFLLLLLLLVAAGWLAANWPPIGGLERVVARSIERAASEATGTAVTVQRVRLSLRTASATIEGLAVDNPEGFEARRAATVARIELSLDPAAQSRELIRLRQVDLDDAIIVFEHQGTRTNIQQLLDQLNSRRGQSPSADTVTTRLIIDQLRLTEGQVEVRGTGRGNKPQLMSLPPIELRDIGEAGSGTQAREVARQILQVVLQRALVTGAEVGLRGLIEQGSREVEDQLRERGREAMEQMRLRDRESP